MKDEIKEDVQIKEDDRLSILCTTSNMLKQVLLVLFKRGMKPSRLEDLLYPFDPFDKHKQLTFVSLYPNKKFYISGVTNLIQHNRNIVIAEDFIKEIKDLKIENE